MNLEKSKQVIQAWYELNNHPKFGQNPEVNYQTPYYIIEPHLEDGTGTIDRDSSKNIHLRYWYEIIIPRKKHEWELEDNSMDNRDLAWQHVWDMDGSSNTYEDAILDIHKKMIDAYGPYENLFAGITIEQILGIEYGVKESRA